MALRKISLLIFILSTSIFIPSQVNSQVVWQHVDHTSIYEFLDEMANMKLIEINSAVKPYSRTFISEKLLELNSHIAVLNQRQRKELEYFIKEYSKEFRAGKEMDYIGKNYFGQGRIPFANRARRADLFYYRDTVFMFSLNPILGANFILSDSASMYHRWNGAEMMFYAGKYLGVYANLRDNYISKAITGPDYLVQETGGGFKNPTYGFSNRDAVEYSEMRGGITAGGKWWNLGLVKEHNVWGNNYNGANILSDRAPSFAQIKLQLNPYKWIELNYFHGWLSSKVADSAATQNYGTGTTTIYVPKYMAANMLTVKPVKHLNVSIGNSIVYSRSINAGYLIPVMFFKSLDHTYSTLGNSQMFIDISSRNLKNFHFFATGYFDDFSFGRLFDDNVWKPWSFKLGGRANNILSNLSVTAEYTRNNVLAWKHYNPETTFESTKYNMGHYLRDNANEYFFMISWKPLPKLLVEASWLNANKGPEYPDLRGIYDPVTGEPLVYSYPFQEEIVWEKTSFGLSASYEIMHDIIIRGKAEYSDINDKAGFTPDQFKGKQIITSFMMTVGF